ncbi:hypothetical protein [Brachybacterium tyrofermentans]
MHSYPPLNVSVSPALLGSSCAARRIRLWGAEPDDASTTITIPLWREDPS